MTTKKTDSDKILRLIDELGTEAEHTDAEAQAALRDSGIDPEKFVTAVRDHSETILAVDRLHQRRRDPFRYWVLGIGTALAAALILVVHVSFRADLQARRDLARAELIAPLLPALTSDDPARRSISLVVVRQIDPAFATETSTQLAQWELSSQAIARANRNAAYTDRFLAGLEKLQLSRDPDDRKVAIWHDLLPVLLEARKNRSDFVDVALQYQRVLPLLRVRNPEVFLDSYWGELWILNILLESKIAPVVAAARQQAPEPAVVKQIFEKNAATLQDRDRRAFEEALSVYETTFKAAR